MVVGQSGKLKVGAIVQARFDSSRLPGKVLMNLPFDSKETILSHIHNRLFKIKNIDEVILATSSESNDDIIERYAKDHGFIIIRGDKNNVLSRFVEVINRRDLDVVVRITADNPIVLIDILDDAINQHIKNNSDYTYSKDLPYGTGFEIVNANVLKKICKFENITEQDKEHVTIFIRENMEKFNLLELNYTITPTDFRFTVDYPTDYSAMNILFQHLESINFEYDMNTLTEFLSKHQWLHQINNQNRQKPTFNTLEGELQYAIDVLDELGLKNTVRLIKEQNS